VLALPCAAQQAPAFALVNATDGATVSMQPTVGNLKVVFFTSVRCPDARAFEQRMFEIAQRFQQKGVRFYAVDAAGESLAEMKARAVAEDYPYPFLQDDGRVAKAYGVRALPEAFVIDDAGMIRYHGFIDDAPVNRTQTALTDAINALLSGREVPKSETVASGCVK
jgi:peroxiredoxin